MPNSINEKTIETRIINRHDDLANWESSNLILKEGEIALAKVTTTKQSFDSDGKPLYDEKTNTPIYIEVPSYLIKIGDGEKTFKELNWLAAPASDVYAWAKKEEFDYKDSSILKDLIENYNKTLDGIGAFGEGSDKPSTVMNAISIALNRLNSEDVPTVDGDISLAVKQEGGLVSISYGKIANKNIADDANISMGKVENLTTIHTTLYGTEGTSTNVTEDGLVSKVQNIENRLGDQGRVMEFVGTYKSTKEDLDKHTANGYLVPGSSSAEAATEATTNAIQLQKGDVVAIVSGEDVGKEYIWSSTDGTKYVWEELGHAGATDKALEDFANKVLNNGLSSNRLSNEEGAPTKTLEQEFLDRTSHLEKVVGSEGYNTESNGPGSLTSRTETIENTLENIVPQLDGKVLKINKEVLIFDCGTSAPREYLGEQSTPTQV